MTYDPHADARQSYEVAINAMGAQKPITAADVVQSKRAVVAMMECLKAGMNGKPLPFELRQDVAALMALIRKVEAQHVEA